MDIYNYFIAWNKQRYKPRKSKEEEVKEVGLFCWKITSYMKKIIKMRFFINFGIKFSRGSSSKSGMLFHSSPPISYCSIAIRNNYSNSLHFHRSNILGCCSCRTSYTSVCISTLPCHSCPSFQLILTLMELCWQLFLRNQSYGGRNLQTSIWKD